MRNDNLKVNDIFWNTLGTVTYAAVSLLLSLVILNIAGKIEGGIFSFGFSTIARLTFIVTFFGIRPMHIVDIKYVYSFTDYIKFGLKCCAVAILAGTSFIFYKYYEGQYAITKTILLLILIFHGALDGLADYYECEYQRVNKLAYSGQSLFFRILLFTITLILVLYFTSNLLYAEIAALLVEIIAFYFLNIKKSKNVFKTIQNDLSSDSTKNLFLAALPLFLINFLDMFIFSLSKFFVDSNVGDVGSGFYGLLFMPTNAIYLVMTLFMKPMLTPLSNAYYNNKTEYNKLLINSTIFAFGLAIISLIASFLLGKGYLNIIYYLTGNNYSEYSNVAIKLFIIVILGGCFYTMSSPIFFSLIIENKQKYLLISYIIVAICSFFIIRHYVFNLNILGAAIGFSMCMFLVFVGILLVKLISIIIK